MPRLVRALLALVLLSVAFSSNASLWFGDEDGVHRVNTDTNRADLNINSSEPIGLSVNSTDGSVWSLTRSRIAKYNAAGATVFSRTLSSYSDSIGSGRQLAVNAANGSAWVTGERRLLHISPAGALLSVASTDATDMAVAQDGTLWILDEGDNEIRRYANEGALLSRTHLSGVSRESLYIALDDTRGVFWLGGDHSLVKRSLANPSTVLKTITTSDEVNALSLDVQTGEVWVLGRTSFYGYRPDGTRFVSEYVGNDGVYDPETLAFDIGTQAIWIGHRNGLTRFTRNGNKVATIRANEVDTVAVSRAAVVIDPTIALVAPTANSTITNTRPAITFQYGANCSGASCAFPPSYFSTFTINATVNGASVGSQFVFDPATGRTSFTPATALPQGANSVTGQAVDATGRTSAVLSAQFTVDSVAPQFGAVTPATGTTFSAAPITIAGSVNDASARVRLSGVSADQGAAFSFPVTLAAGINNFTLTATDAAGNASTLPLTYTFTAPNLPPTVSITAPANGATFTAPASFTITATASDADGTIASVAFFSNGVSLGVDATAPYSFNAANLGNGAYVLTAVATDNRGAATTSTPVTVTVGTANALPTVQLTSPANGTAYSAPATIVVKATASDSDGTISKVEFLRNGVVAATVTAPPYQATLANVPAGTQVLTARATDDRNGVATSAPVTVTATALAFTINSPADGSAIDSDNVLVKGHVGGLANTGVVVNGAVAAVDAAGNFSALASLVAGANTITAVATGPDGNASTLTRQVTATARASPFLVHANPAAGLAPLPVSFIVSNPSGADARFMFDTFGPFDLPAGSTLTLSLTYPAGVFTPKVVFTPVAGGTPYAQDLVVNSRDPASLDQLLRQAWGGLNGALAAGDKDGAQRYLSGGAKEKFGPVFDALMPFMGSIVASYSPLGQSSLREGIAEYAVTRMDGTRKRLYFIYFLLDADGVWRIDEM
ncbi:hypothetical protein BWI17_00845 [Betaproteobacteria bacterium GR16-43]|nr:hypothetical protein BWI17_00845 [Betaproteobacteria bacterium GR16-43]